MSSSMMMASEKNKNVIRFSMLKSSVDEGFWWRLSSLKLDTLGLDQSPIPITGFYKPSSHDIVPSRMSLYVESLPDQQPSSPVRGDRNKCPVPGTLYNMNTVEDFQGLDRGDLLKREAKKIWDDICSGRAIEEGTLLLRFFVISFADLKKSTFSYWFAFPALFLNPPATLVDIRPASQFFNLDEAKSLSVSLNEWRNSKLTTDVPFFLVCISSDEHATIRPLRELEDCQHDAKRLLFGFYDSCNGKYPGWPLCNYLALICSRWKLEKVRFLCYRESNRGFPDLGRSLVGEALVSVPQEWRDVQHVPKSLGWELDGEKLSAKCVSLARSMDPLRSAEIAADLNLKLMKWNVFKDMDLETLTTVKCLLLGAGTLGCQVARLLMVGATRKVVAGAYGQRCGKENLFILENLVRLRHKYARLLGYSNYSDYALESKMAKSSIKVFEFLEDISGSLTDLATKELNLLKDFKRKEEGDSPFGIEDLLYYMRRVEEQKFDDLGIVKQYFPVKLVLSGVFKIFQDLFGLIFEEIEEAEVWHGTVRLFSVLDFTSRELLGYFYLDIFSRQGKYGHACVVALQNSYFSSNGNHQIPVALIMSQVQKQVDGEDGLLRFSEVVSLFHEFMHVVHHICNRATFSRFSGLRVDGDFVEIPGRMMENWCYESLSLKLISGFHQDITKPITIDMCRSLKKRRDSFSGLKLKQEILYCLIDQVIHSNDNIDIVELLKNLHPKVMLGLPLLEGTNPATCFPRLAIGYEAASYSCIWSEVFAADVFASKFQDDILSQHAGLQFRNKVLAPGGSKDPSEILSGYLGREPSIQAFIECKTSNSLI